MFSRRNRGPDFHERQRYPVTDKQPHAQAIAVKGDRIVFVGTNAAAKRFQGKNTRVVDLRGATVVPGLADAHAHFTGVGQREMNLNLEGITTLEDFLAKVKERVDQAKPGEGSPPRLLNLLEAGVFRRVPSRQSRAEHPSISRARTASIGANSAALINRGRNEDTKDPFGDKF